MTQVIILQGVSGAGKSSYIKEHCPSTYGAVKICSADTYFTNNGKYKFDASKLSMAHGMCFKQYLWAVDTRGRVPLSGSPQWRYIVVDNTNTTIEEIAPYMAVAQAFEIPVEIVTFRVPTNIAASRNVHGVPAFAIERMQERINAMVFPRHWKFHHRVVNELGALISINEMGSV